MKYFVVFFFSGFSLCFGLLWTIGDNLYEFIQNENSKMKDNSTNELLLLVNDEFRGTKKESLRIEIEYKMIFEG